MTGGLLGLVLVALLMSTVGSFAPVFCAEAFVGIVAAGQPAGPAVAVALAAAAGQTAGKTLVLVAARSASGRWTGSRWAAACGRLLARLDPRGAAITATGARGTGRTSVRTPLRTLSWAHARAAQALDGPAAPPVVLLSGAVGLPPLLAVTLYASGSRMRVRSFAAACGAGRALRMLALAGAAWAAAG